MKTLAFALGMALATTIGMAQADTREHDMPQHQMASPAAQSNHIGYGVLKAVNEKARKVQIAHEPIPSLNWTAMTMWFALREPLPEDLHVGDAVRFELMQGEKKQWLIINIRRK